MEVTGIPDPGGPAKTIRVRVAPGVTLHAERWPGQPWRTPFLLLHGLASNLRLWDGVAASLSARGHPVVAVDQRGHGQSDTPDEGYDLPTAVADALAVLEALHLDRPVVAGQSWGGNVVLELASCHPSAVRGLAGIDGGLIELAENFPTWDACLEALAPPLLAGLPLSVIRHRIQSMQVGWPPAALAAALANFRVLPDATVEPRLRRDRHVQLLRSLWDHRPSARLSRLTVPAVFLLVDSGDEIRTAPKRRAAERVPVAAPGARVEWIAPAHHDVHSQQPGRVAHLLLSAVDDGFFP